MRTPFIVTAIFGSLLLGACSAPGQSEIVTNSPTASPAAAIIQALPGDLKDRTTLDLQTTAKNFDNATELKPPLPDMPLFASCVHLINQELGVEPVPGGEPPVSVLLENQGIFSLGSELIVNGEILANQVTGEIVVPQNCVTAFGNMNLQALGQIFSKLPGGSPIKIKTVAAMSATDIRKIKVKPLPQAK